MLKNLTATNGSLVLSGVQTYATEWNKHELSPGALCGCITPFMATFGMYSQPVPCLVSLASEESSSSSRTNKTCPDLRPNDSSVASATREAASPNALGGNPVKKVCCEKEIFTMQMPEIQLAEGEDYPAKRDAKVLFCQHLETQEGSSWLYIHNNLRKAIIKNRTKTCVLVSAVLRTFFEPPLSCSLQAIYICTLYFLQKMREENEMKCLTHQISPSLSNKSAGGGSCIPVVRSLFSNH